MKKIFIIILILVVLAFGYNYVVKNYGTKNLDVTYSIEDATKFEERIKTSSETKKSEVAISPKDTVVNSGVTYVKDSITNVEATALANKWSTYWQYAPLLDSKIIINPDNTVEYSGRFDLTRAIGYASVTGVSQSVVDAVKKYIQPFGTSFPIYAKGTVSITDNVVNAGVADFKIGVVPITTVVNQYSSEINQFVTQRLSVDSKYGVKSLTVSDNKINFEGNIPSKVEFYSN